MINNSGLTLNGLTVNDYLANQNVHFTGGADAENENDDDDVEAENEDDEILSRLTRGE